GDACTFETLVNEFVPGDAALREIAEIVHDVDCKDAKFRRDEAPGLARMITGIAMLCERDQDRLERGRTLFDELYAAFGGAPAS
ncbi:MAG TPA: chromate resistance protein ChrB domain-containing protein, partial [Gemmatimonadaceae bacterium]|nr:chromate resistance protein ChrB domain-containing protein [Gemmatimonadaceae bacterium]